MANKSKFTANLTDDIAFKKDAMNFFSEVNNEQIPTIGNLSMLDVFLRANNCFELHYHINATELIYVISGEVEVGLLNAGTNEWESFRLARGEVISVPQGWWHYVCAVKNHTHFLAIFDTGKLETIFGSDMLRKTPPSVLAHIYCLDETKVEEVLKPIDETVVIGPPADCEREMNRDTEILAARNDRVTDTETSEGNDQKSPGEEKLERDDQQAGSSSTPTSDSYEEENKRKEQKRILPVRKINPQPFQKTNKADTSQHDAMSGQFATQQPQYYNWQSMLELEQQQMLQPHGYYGNVMPLEICQICLGYRY